VLDGSPQVLRDVAMAINVNMSEPSVCAGDAALSNYFDHLFNFSIFSDTKSKISKHRKSRL